MKSVVLLCVGDEGYGIRRSWRGLTSSLRDLKIQYHVLVLVEGSVTHDLREAGHPFTLLSKKRELATLERGPKFIKLALRIAQSVALLPIAVRSMRNLSPATIVVRSPPEVFFAGLFGLITSSDVIWLMPNEVSSAYPFEINKKIYRLIFRLLPILPVGNSAYTISTLMSSGKKHFIHLGVDPLEFEPGQRAQARRKFKLENEAIVFGVAARLIESKGHTVLVEALARLRLPGVHLIIAGGPLGSNYHRALEKRVLQLGLGEQVSFIGATDTMKHFYDACDVVINARIDAEPFGFSVIEAMMMGKPVLAHAAGGPSETIEHGVTGWLVDSATVDAFEAGLAQAWADRYQWNQMGGAARNRALSQFTNAAMTKRLLALIDGRE